MNDYESGSDHNSVDLDAVDWITNAECSTDASEEAPEEVIDGADLLDRILAFFKRFVNPPSEDAAIAVALWVAHTHFIHEWETTPRLFFSSAEPGSGKSRAMEIAALFCPRALVAANATTASLVRAVEDPAGTPTFFIDEIDTKFGPKAKGDEELRCLLNAGHGRGGYFLRCEAENDQWVPVKKNAFAAVAIAGIGNIPDTILTRSIVVKMRTSAPDERVEPYRRRDHRFLGESLRDELAEWARIIGPCAGEHRPALPPGIVDRNADVWEPLVVVADMAGGQWPALAREAALRLIAATKADVAPSMGLLLLNDIHECFGSDDRLPTKELLRRLKADEESPWGELFGKSNSERTLAEMLRPYGVRSASIRMPDGSTPKGYKREAFVDPWRRLLPRVLQSATTATADTEPENSQKAANSGVAEFPSSPPRPQRGGGCGNVADPESS